MGQAATLSCPIPSSANQKGFDVCLKMKPRYANVFMMLAMFLQSSRGKRRKMFRQGQIQEPRPGEEDISGLHGNISSLGLGWVILGLQEVWTLCFSVP